MTEINMNKDEDTEREEDETGDHKLLWLAKIYINEDEEIVDTNRPQTASCDATLRTVFFSVDWYQHK